MLLYSYLPRPRTLSMLECFSSGFSGSLFLAWPLKGTFLSSYDPRHCPLTQQGHKHRYSRCLAALEPRWGGTTKILELSVKRSLFFRRYWTNRTSRQNIKHTTWKSSSMRMCWYLQRVHSSNTTCKAIFWSLSLAMPTIVSLSLAMPTIVG